MLARIAAFAVAAVFLTSTPAASQSHDIIVDGNLLSQVSPDEQKRIIDVLKASKLIDGDVKFEAGSSPQFIPGINIPGLSDICRAACDAAAAAAATGCTGSAAAVALCLTGVNEAREECRRKC